ncbi:MAG: ABC transporter permease [Bryobacterales bacterium]
MLGRTLADEDEAPGSPAVVVLGHRLWQTRFAGDPAVVGRSVRMGETLATVVGVMPETFAFPVDDNVWTPLRSEDLVREPGQGSLKVFGRLALARLCRKRRRRRRWLRRDRRRAFRISMRS